MGSDCLLIWDFFGGDGNVLELNVGDDSTSRRPLKTAEWTKSMVCE